MINRKVYNFLREFFANDKRALSFTPTVSPSITIFSISTARNKANSTLSWNIKAKRCLSR